MMERERAAHASVLVLLSLFSLCAASTPLIAWSNREVFSGVTPNDLLNTNLMLNEIREDLLKLNFIIVFSAQSLEFDDIVRYGGVYGDNKDAPLASLQAAMVTAASSVWGEIPAPQILIEELPHVTYTSAHYLTEMTSSKLLKKKGELQLLVVDLPNGPDREHTLTEHGLKIGHVMETLDALGASYAAFYSAISSHSHSSVEGDPTSILDRETRSTPSADKTNKTHICDKKAILYNPDKNDSTCAVICIHSTTANVTSQMDQIAHKVEPVFAVYRPSWVDMVNKSDEYVGSFSCNMTKLEFDDKTANCTGSSLQEQYLKHLNINSSSIKANMTGYCAGNGTLSLQSVTLEVEFIFFNGGRTKRTSNSPNKMSQLVPLPGNQYLLPGYWTMQLVVRNITDGEKDSTPVYMTQYRHNLDFPPKSDPDTYNITLKRGLFYPFSIPEGASYACVSDKDHLWGVEGNPNRFVITTGPFNLTKEVIKDGPILQFAGLQVQAYGRIYGITNYTKKPPTVEISFNSVYECQGYSNESSWTGTFVVLILIVMLYFSILALFSTPTVDRFDDPRGRTITVENLH